MNARAYNFGAGPTMLPLSILKEAQEELLNWQGLGMSVMEIGHRTTSFQALIEALEAELREVASIPAHYHVLFLGGAARTQFAMIPMNFLHDNQQAAFLISGIWSSLAFKEASLLKKAYILESTEASGFTCVPNLTYLKLLENTSYVYYTPNETINGVRFSQLPDVGKTPLIADLTSCFLTEPFNINNYGLVFAGAQKNIAPAGLSIVVIRADWLDQIINDNVPTMLNYKIQAQHHSLYATPPVYNCYLAEKMMKWIKAQGGVEQLYRQNCQKALTLYQYIDDSSFYFSKVEKTSRSIVNVCFSLVRPELEPDFLLKASQRGLLALQGHRLVGGLRASLYNAMPMAGVEELITFMDDFSKDQRL